MNQTTMELHARAYEALGVSQDDVSRSIQITPQLKAVASVIRRAGLSKAARSWPWYLETSDHADARKLLDIYYSTLKSHRRFLPIEAFCVAAGVSPLRILELITATCVRLGAQAATIIAAVNHPRVVEKTVEMALTDDGHLDRSDLHKAVGFLPTAKGSHTIVNVQQVATATAQAAVAAPPPENTIRRMVNRFNDSRAPALPADTGSIPVPEVMPHEELEPVAAEGEEEEDTP
jgi:hypothetical protein